MRKRFLFLLAVAAVLGAFLLAVPASATYINLNDVLLGDTTNFVNESSTHTLNGRTDLSGDPGYRFNITFSQNSNGWQAIKIADDFDHPSDNAGISHSYGDLSSYDGIQMTFHNPNSSGYFMATICINTGWTDAPWKQTDGYYQPSGGDNGWFWLAPGDTRTITLDFSGANYWDGSTWSDSTTVLNKDHITNIGFQIGSNMGTGNYHMPAGSAFDADVVPIPGTVLLLGSGLLGLVGVRRIRLRS